MDITDVVSTLERHRERLASENSEIQTDLHAIKGIGLRHDSLTHFDAAARILRQRMLLHEKQLKEINTQLDLFRLHVPKARALCKKIAAASNNNN